MVVVVLLLEEEQAEGRGLGEGSKEGVGREMPEAGGCGVKSGLYY